MDYDYKELLKKAEKELPESMSNTERFKIEPIKGHIEGNKTILVNFNKIIKSMNREPEQAFKYLLKELATPGKTDGDRRILGAKVAASKINKKIRQYACDYVLCPECGKPDTQLLKKEGISHIRCGACGSERPIKAI